MEGYGVMLVPIVESGCFKYDTVEQSGLKQIEVNFVESKLEAYLDEAPIFRLR